MIILIHALRSWTLSVAPLAWLGCRCGWLATRQLGPWFGHEAGQPCWHCLDARLMRNQPVRAWWRSRPAGQRAGLPESHQPDATALRLRLLAEALVRRPQYAARDCRPKRRDARSPQPAPPAMPRMRRPRRCWRRARRSRCAWRQRANGWGGGRRAQTSQEHRDALIGRSQPADRRGGGCAPAAGQRRHAGAP